MCLHFVILVVEAILTEFQTNSKNEQSKKCWSLSQMVKTSKPDDWNPVLFCFVSVFVLFCLVVLQKTVFVQGTAFAKLCLSSLRPASRFYLLCSKYTPMSLLWNVRPRAVYTGSWQGWPPPGCLCPLLFLLLINILHIWLQGSILEGSDATFVNKHNIPGENYCLLVCFNNKEVNTCPE